MYYVKNVATKIPKLFKIFWYVYKKGNIQPNFNLMMDFEMMHMLMVQSISGFKTPELMRNNKTP